MKSLFVRSILIVSLVLTLSTTLLAQQNQNEPLTNAAVVKLAKAGFKEKTIISIISARIPAFDLSPDRMIELKRSGVSEKIIVAMLARQEGMDPFDDESWGDDMSVGSLELPKGSSPGNGPANGSDPGTNIFGSSGGARGETRSRGGNGSASGETVTTGSATVRILKPPAEAGSAGPTKLEKAKTLTNDSIVELVEAGFSEGTIIRRIEQSPVEFDLATAKLEELRKQRVSEKIRAAMKVAMGDEPIK